MFILDLNYSNDKHNKRSIAGLPRKTIIVKSVKMFHVNIYTFEIK